MILTLPQLFSLKGGITQNLHLPTWRCLASTVRTKNRVEKRNEVSHIHYLVVIRAPLYPHSPCEEAPGRPNTFLYISVDFLEVFTVVLDLKEWILTYVIRHKLLEKAAFRMSALY